MRRLAEDKLSLATIMIVIFLVSPGTQNMNSRYLLADGSFYLNAGEFFLEHLIKKERKMLEEEKSIEGSRGE